MMPPKQQLTHSFPHRIIFITSLVLCACATCSIVLSVISWTNKLWGYYFRTGIWNGVVILLTGILGILCNFVRSISAVKTFLIAAIFGVIVSLALIALSAGGLDFDSGFYSGSQDNEYLSNICHGVSLGVGVLQLTLCILCDGMCIYYLFIDTSQMYKVGDAKAKKKHKPKRDASRASTRSDAPLVGSPSKPKLPKNKKKQRSRSYDDEDQDYQVEYRKPSRLLAGQTTSPNRSPCIRPSSFSTFGRADTGDRASLIVHPGDNASIADTNRSQTPSVSTVDECHYAQTMLFDPPLPIEEDEELPPYQVLDPYSQVFRTPHGPGNPLRRTNSVPLHHPKRNHIEKQRATTVRSNIPRGRSQNDNKTLDTSFLKDPLKKQTKTSPVIKHSQSADLLKTDEPISGHSLMNLQGVSCRDFASLHNDETVVKRRSNSMKGDRSKRIDRKRRALSAEIKVSRDHIMKHEQGMGSRTSSIDGSNCGLFASNRIIPTKFSLRTPIRQIGMPHVRSAIPVKSVLTLPLFSPPPKPPRTFSVKPEDFETNAYECIDQVDGIPTEPDKEKDTCSETAVGNSAKDLEEMVTSLITNADDEVREEPKDKQPNKSTKIAINDIMVIATGPVLKCKVPLQNNSKLVSVNTDKECASLKDTENSSNGITQPNNTVMELQISPTLKCPINRIEKSQESSVIYAKVDKNHDKQGVQTLMESQKITNKGMKENSNGQNTFSTELENSVEDKLSVTIKHTTDVNDSEKTAKQLLDKTMKGEKLGDEIEKHQNLQVRIPSMSASERILKKKAQENKEPSVLSNSSQSRDLGIGPAGIEHNGARPKTNVNNKGKDTYPVPTRRRSIHAKEALDETNNTGSGISNLPNTNRISSSPDKIPRNSARFQSQANANNTKTNVPVISKPSVGLANRHPISSTNSPTRSSPGGQMSGRSQGILHLPQSQHNRHLSTERRSTSNMHAVSQPQIANQNQQNAEELPNALFAKIL